MNTSHSGTYTGNGAVKNIELGFVPDLVILANVTDGTDIAFWWNGMAAATAIDVQLAAATQAANGISAYNGDATHAPGFTVGTAYSTNAKVYRYTAFRSSDPKTQTAGVASGASA